MTRAARPALTVIPFDAHAGTACGCVGLLVLNGQAAYHLPALPRLDVQAGTQPSPMPPPDPLDRLAWVVRVAWETTGHDASRAYRLALELVDQEPTLAADGRALVRALFRGLTPEACEHE